MAVNHTMEVKIISSSVSFFFFFVPSSADADSGFSALKYFV